MADECSISKGARFSVVFRINSTKDCSVEGVYKGMAAMGTETALVFETSEGLSFINASAVVRMDQIGAAPEEPKKKADDRALYG